VAKRTKEQLHTAANDLQLRSQTLRDHSRELLDRSAALRTGCAALIQSVRPERRVIRL